MSGKRIMARNKATKSVIVITIITVICKLLGFIRQIIQAYYYGTSVMLDAIIATSLIITIFFSWHSCLSLAYVPVYNEIKNTVQSDKKNELINELKNNVVTYNTIASILLAIICFFLSDFFVRISLPGFSEELLQFSSNNLKILSISILFVNSAKVFSAFLCCEGMFIKSIIPTLLINITEIVFIIISFYTNIYFFTIGLLISTVLELFLLIVFTNYKFKVTFKVDRYFRKIVLLSLPFVVNIFVNEACNFSDKLFSSFLDDGVITSLSYANSLRKLMLSVCTIGIITIIYPKLSNSIEQHNIKKSKEYICQSLRFVLLVSIPIFVGSIILAKTGIKIVFEHGAFDNKSTSTTSEAFVSYIVGFVALCLQVVMIKILYSFKKVRICTLINVVTVAMNILLDFLLVKRFQHIGVALATSVACIVSIPLYMIAINKEIKAVFRKKDLLDLLKMVFSSLIMGLIVLFIKTYIFDLVNELYQLIIIFLTTVLLGAIVYFLICKLLRLDETKKIEEILLLLFRQRKYERNDGDKI